MNNETLTITDIQVATTKTKMFSIYVEGDFFAIVPPRFIHLFSLSVDAVYSINDILSLGVAANLSICYEDALYILSFSPRSERELFRKLVKKQHLEETILTVLDVLKVKNIINDREFAFDFADRKVSKKNIGSFALRRDLQRKEFERELIEDVIKGIFNKIDARDLALKAMEKRFNLPMLYRKLDKISFQKKIFLFLMQRGFESDIISQLVRRTIEKLEKEDNNKNEEF